MKTVISIAITGVAPDKDDYTYNYSQKEDIKSFLLHGTEGLIYEDYTISHVGLTIIR